MSVRFRDAGRADVASVVDLLKDDVLGREREVSDPEFYLSAFDRMSREPGNVLVVGEIGDKIVATYQITYISGLSLRATRRAQVESVRVASDLRGRGIGAAMLADAEARARAEGCGLIQLTMNSTREGSRAFYEALGFVGSHTGFKKAL